MIAPGQVDTKRTKGMMPLPEHWFFGRQVAAAGRDYLQRYLLPGRRYLGPTSMDAEMAFIMCNHALASGNPTGLLSMQSTPVLCRVAFVDVDGTAWWRQCTMPNLQGGK